MPELKAWRLSKRNYATAAFTGEGSSRTGGRWNSIGVPVVYASLSLSLAVLEAFVHMTTQPGPSNYVYVKAGLHVPEKVTERVNLSKLPTNWKELELPELKAIGDEWVKAQRSLALLVPSVIVPDEWNVLINPLHPSAKKTTLAEPQPFHFDQRLFTARK